MGVVFAQNSDSKLKIVIAGDMNYPPFEFISDDEEKIYRGYSIDVLQAVSVETGIEFEIIPMPWSEAKKALLDGKIDALLSMNKSDEREMFYDFSDPYYLSTQVIFVQTASNAISDLSDLKNKVVALQKGDVNTELLSHIDGANLVYYSDQETALQALIDGKADALLGNKMTGIYHLQQMNRITDVKIVGKTLQINELACAVRNGDATTLKIINKGLNALKSKGTLKQINKKWFGESILDHSQWKSLLILALFISASLSILLALIFLVNKKLQKDVQLRTKELTDKNEIIELKDAQKWHILNSITKGIVVFDKNGKVTLFNQVSRDIIEKGISIGLHWSEIDICKNLGLEIFESVLISKNKYCGNTSLVNGKNETAHINYALCPVDYKNSTQNELILMVEDITREKIFYDAMHQNDKLSTLGKMSASIAHELRNPLNAIKQYVDLLPLKMDNEQFVAQALKVIPSELNRLNEIIEGLLDYSKFTDSHKEMTSIQTLVDDLAMLMKVDFLHRRVKFYAEIEEQSLYVDSKQLKQVLINLVVNALDAMPEAGGIIQIKSYQENKSFVLEVADNGAGIPDIYLDKVFEPYFTTKNTGYGMGLAISKQLIEENGGQMTIDSRVNEGTSIKLKFLLCQ